MSTSTASPAAHSAGRTFCGTSNDPNQHAAPSGAVPGHTSCKGYGELTASEAHAKTLVTELQSLPHGTVDDLIALVQVGGTFDGETVPPFCTPK